MIKGVFACLLAAVSWTAPAADAKDPTSLLLQKGAKVGIVNMMDAEVAHFHTSKVLSQSFLKTPAVSWSIDTMLSDAVVPRLDQYGLVPVLVPPSEELIRARDEIFVNNSVAKGLPRETARQFASLAAAEHLDALIVLAPGLNNSAQAGASGVRRGLPEYLRGFGFVTADTNEKPTLFNMTQMLLIGIGPDGARLQAREWGGSYAEEWSDYVAPADLKQFPPEQLDRLQPLFSRILGRQASRLLDWITVKP